MRARCRERGRQQSPRLGGVNHVVELEQRSRVQRLGVVVRVGDHLLEALRALGLVGDRLELASEAELHGALEPIAPSSAVGQADGQ
jgi:hypothetical protein